MKTFAVVEDGNGSWVDPIEAVDMQAAIEMVRKDLAESNPVDYDQDWTDGDDWPTVEVKLECVETEEIVTRRFVVGSECF